MEGGVHMEILVAYEYFGREGVHIDIWGAGSLSWRHTHWDLGCRWIFGVRRVMYMHMWGAESIFRGVHTDFWGAGEGPCGFAGVPRDYNSHSPRAAPLPAGRGEVRAAASGERGGLRGVLGGRRANTN